MGKTRLRLDGESHASRKFEKKVQFYESVRNAIARKAISKVQMRRSRQKKLNAYDLPSLAECLLDLKAPLNSEPARFKLNSRMINDLVLKESTQLKTVLNHPVFLSDPIGAIYQHLQNTQPAIDEKSEKG